MSFGLNSRAPDNARELVFLRRDVELKRADSKLTWVEPHLQEPGRGRGLTREHVLIERVAAPKLPINKVQRASSCWAICSPIRAASTLRLRSDRVRARSPLYLFLMSDLRTIVSGLWSWIF